jgi:alpha-glucosidase
MVKREWKMAALVGLAMAGMALGQASWEVSSPNDRISLRLILAAPGKAADYPVAQKRLYYEVSCQGKRIVPGSPLGLMVGTTAGGSPEDFVDGLTFVTATGTDTIDETYTLLHGKRSSCQNRFKEKIVTFKNPGGAQIQVVLRASNDGVAFRYQLPGVGGQGSGVRQPKVEVTVLSEATGFRLPENGKVWAHPYDVPGKYTPAYETFWSNGVDVGTTSPSKSGWAFPVLFRNEDSSCWGLVTEAGVDGSYCGSHLGREAARGVYRIRFPDPNEGNGVGKSEPSSTSPWIMPWRIIMVGETLGTIVESTLVTDLSAPSAVKDTSWIKPGRASWSWLSDHDSPQDCTKLKAFVDLAAEMGWEYSLVDANWNIMKNGTIHDLIAYGNSRNVGLLLWYNSGGPHNSVTEQPRGTMDIRDVRRFEFQRLKQWGIKGVKVDFFQSDKQDIIQLYLDILKDAADYQLMVDFHGCTLPRGWERTYPNLMTMEAVRGAESYSFDRTYPKQAPVHNVIQTFTRNVVGPMDYTPVMFADNAFPHITTYGHELALAVVFESGLLHFADAVKPYLELPEAPKAFLKQVPAAWDETRFVAGEPGRFMILARRKGNDWYLGAINGREIAEQVNVPLRFLGQGRYMMTSIGDGKEPRTFDTQNQAVASGDSIPVNLGSYSGFAAVLRPQP